MTKSNVGKNWLILATIPEKEKALHHDGEGRTTVRGKVGQEHEAG